MFNTLIVEGVHPSEDDDHSLSGDERDEENGLLEVLFSTISKVRKTITAWYKVFANSDLNLYRSVIEEIYRRTETTDRVLRDDFYNRIARHILVRRQSPG